MNGVECGALRRVHGDQCMGEIVKVRPAEFVLTVTDYRHTAKGKVLLRRTYGSYRYAAERLAEMIPGKATRSVQLALPVDA